MGAARAKPSANDGPPHPRTTVALFGHRAAEQALLDAYRAGRMPHAWLIGGPPGIGKATLAYRFARFVLAFPDPAAAAVRAATSLDVPAEHLVARRMAAATHGDLKMLERKINEKTGKLFQNIRVEDVRAAVAFFGSTAGEGGWRVAVVDSVDELNREGANAFLKVLEEPPARCLFLLVSHAPGRVLPTIRSRCRMLTLRPLEPAAVAQAAAAALRRDSADPAVVNAAQSADGGVARAIALCGGPLLAVRQRTAELLGRVPAVDPLGLHALGDLLEKAERETFEAFVETVRDWLTAELHRRAQDVRRAAPLADAWSRFNRAARDVETYNLERRPLVFAAFGWLAEAARG